MFASYKCEKHTLQDIYRSNNSVDARYILLFRSKMADKQKAAPCEADLLPLKDCFYHSQVISELKSAVNL